MMTYNSHSNNNYHHNHQDCVHHHQDCDDQHQDACGVKIGRCAQPDPHSTLLHLSTPLHQHKKKPFTKHRSQNSEHKTNNNKRLCTPRHQFALCLLWTCVHKLNIKVQFIEQPTIAQLNNTQP